MSQTSGLFTIKHHLLWFPSPRTLSVQGKRDSPADKRKDVSPRKEVHSDTSGRVDVMMLEGRLQEEVAERRRLELELEKVQRGTVTLEEQGDRERGRSAQGAAAGSRRLQPAVS